MGQSERKREIARQRRRRAKRLRLRKRDAIEQAKEVKKAAE